MTLVNELAVKHGLQPSQFKAILEPLPAPPESEETLRCLRFVDFPEDPRGIAKFERLLADVGITDPDSLAVNGSLKELVVRLQSAVQARTISLNR